MSYRVEIPIRLRARMCRPYSTVPGIYRLNMVKAGNFTVPPHSGASYSNWRCT